MMNLRKLILEVLLIGTLLALSAAVWAKGGSAGKLLSFGSSARDVSLGSAMTSIPQGANSLYWNPALLNESSRKDLSFLQAQLFSKTTLNWMGYAHPFKNRAGTLGVQMMQLKTGTADRRDANNEVQGSFSQSDQVFGLGYGFNPTRNEKLALGLGFNMVRRTLDTASNTLYGLTLGAKYQPVQKLRTGLVLENLLRGKSGDTDDTLPINFKIGNSYELIKGFNLSGDVNFIDFKSPSINVGTELSWRFMSFRAGRPSSGDMSYGFGLAWRSMRLDFAMVSNKDLGASQLFSFGASFGRNRDVTRKALAAEDFAKAQEKISIGDWIGAKALIEKAAKIDSANPDIYTSLNRVNGVLTALAFNGKEKIAKVEQVKFIGADEPARLLIQGVKTFLEGNEVDSVLMLRQAGSYRPQDEKIKSLIEHVEKAGNIKHESDEGRTPEEIVTLRLKKAEELFDNQRYDDALKVCLELVMLVPDMPLARMRLGSVYYAVGDMINARKQYEIALRLNPDDEPLKEFMKIQGWMK